MRRRAMLALTGLTMLVSRAGFAASAGDATMIDAIQAYLNTIHTLKARFTQVAPDGTISNGTAWLWRPGRMRFQYDKPSPLLLVAGGGKVIFRDNSLDQTSSMPVRKSPLGILLADRIDLGPSGGVKVLALQRGPGEVKITLARAGEEAAGKLTLDFSTNPLSLKSWVVDDAQGNLTKVSLYDIDTGNAGFDPALFVYKDPNLPPNRGGPG